MNTIDLDEEGFPSVLWASWLRLYRNSDGPVRWFLPLPTWCASSAGHKLIDILRILLFKTEPMARRRPNQT